MDFKIKNVNGRNYFVIDFQLNHNNVIVDFSKSIKFSNSNIVKNALNKGGLYRQIFADKIKDNIEFTMTPISFSYNESFILFTFTDKDNNTTYKLTGDLLFYCNIINDLKDVKLKELSAINHYNRSVLHEINYNNFEPKDEFRTGLVDSNLDEIKFGDELIIEMPENPSILKFDHSSYDSIRLTVERKFSSFSNNIIARFYKDNKKLSYYDIETKDKAFDELLKEELLSQAHLIGKRINSRIDRFTRINDANDDTFNERKEDLIQRSSKNYDADKIEQRLRNDLSQEYQDFISFKTLEYLISKCYVIKNKEK